MSDKKKGNEEKPKLMSFKQWLLANNLKAGKRAVPKEGENGKPVSGKPGKNQKT